MNVLYDYSAFVMQPRGGVSRVLYELARHVAFMPNVRCKIFAGFHRNEYLKQAPAAFKKNIIGWYLPPSLVKQRIFMPINRFLFEIYARFFQPDICHYTYLDTPKVPKGCKVVMTMHDMIHELFPEIWHPNDPQHEWKLNAVSKVDGIICISENTKIDLARHLDIDGKKVSVIYHGNSLAEIVPRREKVDYRYLLYVGTRVSEYKNFNYILRALAKYEGAAILHLVCFGGGPLTEAEQQQIELLGLSGRVHQVGGSDPILAGYYAGAEALIYPSTYEGFGLPPIEAMGLDCPVLASSAPPMPEIIGTAGLFFDPERESDLHICLKALENDEVREELVQKGRERVVQFTWEKVAHDALNFYQSFM